MIFKVDFEKAFNFICWDFLDDVLKKFGFGARWCDWIQSCLRSSRGSILVNGSPEFQFHKGLRINMHKSKIMGVVVDKSKAVLVAANIGVTKAIHGVDGKLGCSLKTSYSSNWNDIVRELSLLHDKGMDLLGLIKKKTGTEEFSVASVQNFIDDHILVEIAPKTR
ncbi:hypothetical protein Tco_0704879 [Tanacetum coccineum]|uniref:Reverse transcriptase domain-containing protein n=1 Tax=Tanacetum coccineum TaxID=301880 RepID=A0ABQ4Y4L4_9ASTR